MNHTYRVVYNETTNTYVAVAEFTPAKGKKSKSAKSAASKAVLAVAAVGLAGSAWAARIDYSPTSTGQTYQGNLTITGDGEDYPVGNFNISKENTVIGVNTKVIVASDIRAGLKAILPATHKEANGRSVVVGTNSKSQTGSSVVIGHSAQSGNMQGTVAIGYLAQGDDRPESGIGHVAYGNLYNQQSWFRFSDTVNSIGRKDRTRVHSAGVAIGRSSESRGAGVAIGDEARTRTTSSSGVQGRSLGVAIGSYSLSEGGGVAIGSATEATGTNSLAFGRQAAAKGVVSQALGSASATHKDAQGATAIGQSATAVGARSIAFGSSSSNEKYDTDETGKRLHDNTVALGNDDVAIGSNAVSSGLSDDVRIKISDFMAAVATTAAKQGASLDSVKGVLNATASPGKTWANVLSDAKLTTAQIQAVIDNTAQAAAAANNNNPVEFAFNLNQNLQKLVVNGSESVAIGKSSRTFQDRAIAVGKTAHADGNDTISIGTNAKTLYKDSIAVGRDTLAAPATYGVHRPAIAIGTQVTVTGNGSTAIGTLGDWRPADKQKTWNHGTDSLVIGSNSHIGTETIADNERPLGIIGIGNDLRVGNKVSYSTVTGDNGASYGSSGAVYGAFAKGFAEGSVAVGRNAQAGRGKQSAATVKDGYDYNDRATDTAGTYATSVGAYSQATHDNSSAFGRNAAAVADEATALGVYAKATAERATAAGNQAQALRRHAVAVGGGSKDSSNVDDKARAATASAESAIAIGHLSRASGSQSIAIGEGADTLNRAEFNKGWNAASANRNDAGYTAAAEHTKNAIAIGTQAKAFNKDTVAIGRASRAEGESSIAIGTGNVVKGNYSGAVGDPSVVAGAESYTYGNDNVVGSTTTGGFAFGNNNQIGARPVYDTAAGRERKVDPSKSLTNETNASNSTAIGNENAVTTKDTFILGSGINTKRNGERIEVIGETVANSVYLGKDSTAKAGAGTVGNDGSGSLKNQKDDGTDGSSTTAGATGTVNDATVGKLKYSGFQGATAAGVVTVGSAGKERRLQNVAAGEISKTSTDAINGSQLYATNNVLNNLAKSTAQHLGGGATLNDNGSINAPTYNVYKGNTSPATAGSGTTQFVNPASNVGAAITNLNTYVNQGFKVLDNGGATKGVVTPTESIQFVNGNNTTVNITQEAGGVTKIAINANVPPSSGGGTPAPAPTVSAGDNNVTVTPSNSGGSTNYAVKLNPIVTIGGPATTGAANSGNKPVTINGNNGTVSGLSNTAFDPAKNYTGGQAATQEQLRDAYNKGGFTLNTEADGGTAAAAAGKTKTSKVNNGDTVTIAAGAGIKTTQSDNKITIAADIKTGTLTPDTTNAGKAKGSGDDLNHLATTNAVAKAINDSGFNITGEGETKNAELINPGDTLNFKNGTGTTAKVDGANVSYHINTVTAPTVGTNGKVGNVSNGSNSFLTADQTINAINNSGFLVNSGATASGKNTGGTSRLVKTGEEVKFIADSGISITQADKNFTIGLNIDNKTLKVDNGVLKAIGTGSATPYSFSVGDSSGASEFVKSGQTLVFEKTELITPTLNANGGTNPSITFTPNLVKTVPLHTEGHVNKTAIENKLVAGHVLADAINNHFWRFNIDEAGGTATPATTDAKVRAGNKITFKAGTGIQLEQDSAAQTLTISTDAPAIGLGTVSSNPNGTVSGNGNTTDKLTSADEVAKAINASGFNVAGEGGTENAELVNPGDTLNFKNGKGTEAKVDGLNVTYNVVTAAAPTVTNGAVVKPNKGGDDSFLTTNQTIDAINKSGWNIKGNGTQKDLVTAGNSVDFINGAGSRVTVETNATGDATTVKIDTPMAYVNQTTPADQSTPTDTVKMIGSGNDPVQVQNVASGVRGTFTPATAGSPTAAETAKAVENATGNTLNNAVNVGDLQAVQKDLKDTGLKFKGDDGTEITRKLGETLTVKGGAADKTKLTENNIGVVADVANGSLTVKLAENINLGDSGSLKFGDNGPTINNGGIDMQNTAVSNLKGNLTPTYNNGDNKIGANGKPDGSNVGAGDITKSAAAPTVAAVKDMYNNAATVGDVLNAGWNLQGNGEAVDFVKPYDTVNFINGTGTAVEVKADADGKISNIKVNTLTSLVTADGTPVVQVGDKFYKAEDIDPATGKPLAGKTEIDTAANPISVSVINPTAATGSTTTTPVQLGNIAAGAKTFDAPKNANNEDLKLANDGKWYKAGDVKADGTTDASAVAQTPVQPVSGSLKGGLIDFAKSNPTNALTVADAQNMGWVLSADGGYSDQVRNANEVKFVGGNGAKVSGETVDGVRTLTVAVDAQKVTEAAQLPVVYTDKDGNKLVKGKDAADQDVFYPATVTLGADGKPTDAADYAKAIDPAAKPGDIIASMNNGGNSTAAPMQLANIKGNLAPTYNKGDAEEDAAGKLGTTTAAAATKSAAAPTADEIKAMYNNAATVGDVLNAGFNLQGNGKEVDFVKPYDTVNFVNGVGTTVNVTADADGKVSSIRVDGLVGVTDKDGNKLVQADDGKWYKAGDVVNGKANTGATEVLAGDTAVNLINPNGTDIAKAGDVVRLGNVKGNLNRVNKDGEITAPDGTQAATASADNLKQAPALPPQFNEKAPGYDPKVLNNAATMGDVLNAGWNLKENGEARDFVRHTDSVEFVNGGNTIAVVETAADGSGSTIGVHVTGLPVQYVSENGTPVVKVGDEYFEVGADGKPTTVKVDADKLTANVINPAAPKNGKGNPAQLGNIDSGLKTYATTTPSTAAPKAELVDLDTQVNGTKVSDNTAATVGDLRNMGWIVSADKTTGNLNAPYSAAVKNANEVKFVGINGATVSGETDTQGVRTITVDVNAQAVSNASQLPAVYTKADGTKVALNPIDNKFYPAKADGSPDTTLAEVPKADVIVSLNNGDNSSTAPSQLANVKGNLAPTYNEGDNKIGADGKPDGTTTVKADITKSVINPLNTAATTPATADEIKAVYNNAATVGDVLNAGWNLQGNGAAVDFVKPYDTVSFVNGVGTTVNVSASDDGKVNTIRVDGLVGVTDANGNKLVKAADGKWYKAEDVVNGQPKAGATEVAAGDTAVNLINPNGTDEAKAGDAVQLGNIAAGAGTKDVATKPTGVAGTPSVNAKLADLDNAKETNALTVADAKNLGWVVSAGDNYTDVVKHANEVKFVGANGAKVTGATDAQGVRTITVEVDAQTTAESAQLPVVYTDKDGNKLHKIVDPVTGAVSFNTKPDGTGTTVQPADVIASMNNGGNSTTAPTQLANVKGNLAPTYNVGDKQEEADGKLGNTPAAAATKEQAAPTDVAKLYNNAATVGDVLNAGFNLQANGTAVDFVKPYDTVDFVNGFGAAVTATNTDGKTTSIRIDTPMAYADAAGATTDASGKPLAPTNTVKMIGSGSDPVQVQNLASGVRGQVSGSPTNQDIANAVANASGDTLNNAVNVGDLQAVQAGLNAATNQPLTFAGDSGNNVERKLGQTLKIHGGETDAAKLATGNNIGVVADDTNGALKIQLAKNIDLGKDGSVTMGDTKVDNDGLTINGGPSVTKGGINAGNKQITNVADGTQDTDAVNLGQLKAATKNIAGNTTAINDIKTALGDTTKIRTYDVKGNTETHHITVVDAIENMNREGIRFFHTNDGTTHTAGNVSNTEDSSASGAYATAIGYQAVASAESAIAIGKGAEVSGKDSIAIGKGNRVTGNHSGAFGDPSIIHADQSYTVGNDNYVSKTGGFSYVLGSQNSLGGTTERDASGKVTCTVVDPVTGKCVAGINEQEKGSAENSVAIGSKNSIFSDNVMVVGNNVTIAENTSGAVALGHNTAVSQANGVALGASSVADRAPVNATKATVVSEQIGGATNAAHAGNAKLANTVYAMKGASDKAKQEVADTATNTLAAVSVGSATQNRQITGVAAGGADNDAVNVAQLRSVQSASAAGITQLGNRLNQLGDQIGDVAGGVAQGLATAGLPQAYLPGKSLVAAGVGYFQGHTGYAVGISSISDGGNWIIKGTASGSTRGGFGASAAIGYQW